MTVRHRIFVHLPDGRCIEARRILMWPDDFQFCSGDPASLQYRQPLGKKTLCWKATCELKGYTFAIPQQPVYGMGHS